MKEQTQIVRLGLESVSSGIGIKCMFDVVIDLG